MRENAERLLRLIEHLLALARLQRAEYPSTFQPVDPVGLLRRAAESAQARAEDKHVEIVVADGKPVPAVAADEERLGLALANLVDNAVTYTPSGGKVTLAADSIDGQVALTISDTGVGIPREHLPHVFDKFFRVPGQSAEGGTGLGLSIVKEIATAHRGHVTCESDSGAGTTFRITLPTFGEMEQPHDE